MHFKSSDNKGRAGVSYHMRAHMSYFKVILLCYSPRGGGGGAAE